MARKFCFVLILLLSNSQLHADALGGKLGFNLWAQQSDARARKGGQFIDFDATFDIDDETNYQVYFALEHPIPLLPNLLVQHTNVETQGDGVVQGTTFDRVVLEGNVIGDLDLTHTDVTGYYELLDGWVNLDLGLTIRKFDAGVVLVDENGNRGELKIDDIVPLLYGTARFDLPFTGWYLQADGNFIQFDGDKVIDVRAALGWEIFAGLGLEMGYRYMDIDYGFDSGLLESTTSGIYGGLFWDF